MHLKDLNKIGCHCQVCSINDFCKNFFVQEYSNPFERKICNEKFGCCNIRPLLKMRLSTEWPVDQFFLLERILLKSGFIPQLDTINRQCWAPASRFALAINASLTRRQKNRRVTRCREFLKVTRCRVTRRKYVV